MTAACSKLGAHALVPQHVVRAPRSSVDVVERGTGTRARRRRRVPCARRGGFPRAGRDSLARRHLGRRVRGSQADHDRRTRRDARRDPAAATRRSSAARSCSRRARPARRKARHASTPPRSAPRSRCSTASRTTHGETMLIAAPLFHSWGFGNVTIGLVLGDTFVLHRRFDPEADARVDRTPSRRRCSPAVPVMLQRILELPADVRSRYDARRCAWCRSRARRCRAGSPPRWMDEFGAEPLQPLRLDRGRLRDRRHARRPARRARHRRQAARAARP